jgi:hypothetical protein
MGGDAMGGDRRREAGWTSLGLSAGGLHGSIPWRTGASLGWEVVVQ